VRYLRSAGGDHRLAVAAKLVNEDESLADDPADLHVAADGLAERSDDLLRSTGTAGRVEPRADPQARIQDVDPSQERTKVVIDLACAACPPPRQLASFEQGGRGFRQLAAIDLAGKLDSIVGCGERRGQGRRTEPHVMEIEQVDAFRQCADDDVAHLADGQPLREDKIRKLALGRHPNRERDSKTQGRALAWPIRVRQGQATAGQPFEPRVDDLTVREFGRARATSEDQPPALSRLCDRPCDPSRGRTGIGFHVC
jgi:hypothetical protein